MKIACGSGMGLLGNGHAPLRQACHVSVTLNLNIQCHRAFVISGLALSIHFRYRSQADCLVRRFQALTSSVILRDFN